MVDQDFSAPLVQIFPLTSHLVTRPQLTIKVPGKHSLPCAQEEKQPDTDIEIEYKYSGQSGLESGLHGRGVDVKQTVMKPPEIKAHNMPPSVGLRALAMISTLRQSLSIPGRLAFTVVLIFHNFIILFFIHTTISFFCERVQSLTMKSATMFSLRMCKALLFCSQIHNHCGTGQFGIGEGWIIQWFLVCFVLFLMKIAMLLVLVSNFKEYFECRAFSVSYLLPTPEQAIRQHHSI